jgi:hypothetical protein
MAVIQSIAALQMHSAGSLCCDDLGTAGQMAERMQRTTVSFCWQTMKKMAEKHCGNLQQNSELNCIENDGSFAAAAAAAAGRARAQG